VLRKIEDCKVDLSQKSETLRCKRQETFWTYEGLLISDLRFLITEKEVYIHV